MKKAIHLQHINESGLISKINSVPWCSVTWDNHKMVIDAYQDGIQPRTDCKIEILDGNEVFQLDAEDLLQAVRYFVQYSDAGKGVIRYPNKFHYIIPDAIKPRQKGHK